MKKNTRTSPTTASKKHFCLIMSESVYKLDLITGDPILRFSS